MFDLRDEKNEKQANNMIKDYNRSYDSAFEQEPLSGLEDDDEIRAAVEYFENRVNAIANYSNDFFVERSIERLQAQFEKRAEDPNISPVLANLYNDMISDLPYKVHEQRHYFSNIGRNKK